MTVAHLRHIVVRVQTSVAFGIVEPHTLATHRMQWAIIRKLALDTEPVFTPFAENVGINNYW